MSYSRDVYQTALNMLRRRRDEDEAELQRRTNDAMSRLPQLEEIQRKLQRIGLNVSRAVFDGNAEQKIEELKNESLRLQKEKRALLKSAGLDEDELSERYFCPACRDTGYVNGEMCVCHTELLKEITREAVRRNAPLDECTFETFKTEYYPGEAAEKAQKIAESCRRYASQFTPSSPNLLIMGGTGLGKTHLSLAIANIVISRGYSVIYGTSQNIFSQLQDEKFARAQSGAVTERGVLETDLLIIDDLGTEYKNQFTAAMLYNTINTRLLKRRATIISTNFTFDDLERDYDQRITSRLTGEYSPLVLEGGDIRSIR